MCLNPHPDVSRARLRGLASDLMDAAVAILTEPEDQPGVVVIGVVAKELVLGVAALAISGFPEMASNVQDP